MHAIESSEVTIDLEVHAQMIATICPCLWIGMDHITITVSYRIIYHLLKTQFILFNSKYD